MFELALLAERMRADIDEPGVARDLQYTEARYFVARRCHLLLALGDGKPSERRGGTAQTMAAYLTGCTATGAAMERDTMPRLYGGNDERLLCHLVCLRVGEGCETPGVVRLLTPSQAKG